MFFAQSGVDWPFVGCVVLVGGCFVVGLVWTIYMATFRTSDFIELAKLDEERKRRLAKRRDRQMALGLSLVKWCFRK
jgi:hypothetical protein